MDLFFNGMAGIDEEEEVEYDSTRDYSSYNYNRNYNLKKYTHTCSMCGHDHDSVDRNSNNGVCCDCLLECVDIESKKQAFIKNFRLKREIGFTNDQFKIVI